MSEPETIILLSVDDLRYDCVEASADKAWLEQYGAAEAVETPELNSVVADGVAYESATSTSSYTPPSHASLFTGAYPSEHGVKTFFNRLSEQRTLASELSERGYKTVAWIENMALEMLDVTAGFDEVVCPFEDEDVNLFQFIDGVSGEEKVFAFVHLFDVHKPYGYTTGGTERTKYNEDYPQCLDPLLPDDIEIMELVVDARTEAAETIPNYDELTEPLREYAHYWSLDYLLRQALESKHNESRFEYLVRLYVEGVNRFDSGRLSDLLERIEAVRSDDSLFLFTSDHGETRCQWGNREDMMNSFNVSEGAVRVPLVIQGPSQVERELADSDCPVSHIDVYPTVLDATGYDIDAPSGETLLEPIAPDRTLFNESWYYSGGADFFGNVTETGEGGLSEVGVRQGDCKLIRRFAETSGDREVVKDLAAPIPEETDASAKCAPLDGLRESMTVFLHGVEKECKPDIGDEQDDMEEQLKALGYLE